MMQRQISRWLKGGLAATFLIAGASVWATTGHIPFLCCDIGPTGKQLSTGTHTQFNYVLTGNKFHGKATAKVKNAYKVKGKPHEAKFKNVGFISGFTIKKSLYDVKVGGKATYTASGTHP